MPNSCSIQCISNSETSKWLCVNMDKRLRLIFYGIKSINKPLIGRIYIRNYSAQVNELVPEEFHNQRTIKVAIIGVPNAGKSTFINSLIDHRVCPTSNKVHTTRKSHAAITTVNDNQIILFDTPGLVTDKEVKKHHLESTFSSSYRNSIQHANMIGVIHDISNHWTRSALHPTVLETLNTYPKLPSFLVLNKIDTMKSKRILLELVKTLTNDQLSLKGKPQRRKKVRVDEEKKNEKNTDNESPVGWSYFSEVFMVSSITGDGVAEVLRFISSQGKPGKWEYNADAFTDETPENLIVESVRARLLDYLPQEIPYNLKCQIEYYSVEKNTIYASVEVTCPNQRVEKLLCGVSNGKLKQITERVTSDLVETFAKPISLTISTVVKNSE